ncbi:DUF6083 domain-containing protein [Streptomyces apricus]|uniref:DUF6083 domain-containing protein n=1 Tax=Streptomyces apricus TaxID=1828112 RepID=UPI001CAA895C
MHSSPARRHWDRSPVQTHPRRSLCVEPDSPTRLLRCAQRDRCRECGNPVEWYPRVRDRPVRLHPRELLSAEVPAAHRWHVSSGLAHSAGDGTAWCRLVHAVVCPARDSASVLAPALAKLRRALAVNTRRLTDAGAFVLTSDSDRPVERQDVCRPARPIIQILYIRYLAARPVDEIRCVAQKRNRGRCTSRMISPDSPAGIWTLAPATASQGQLALPSETMALYDLSKGCCIRPRLGRSGPVMTVFWS